VSIKKHDDQTARKIFNLAFNKLRELSIENKFNNEILERKSRAFEESKPNSYFYEILVRDIFGAGMKSSVIENKLPSIKKAFADFDIMRVNAYDDSNLRKMLLNPSIIRNERKLWDCILNARKMKALSDEFGSFGKYLSQHSDNVQDLALELKHHFHSVGDAVALNYLKDVGMDTIKPDVHVLRIFNRLGFLDSEKQSEQNTQKTIKVAERMKVLPSDKLSVIDAVFWMYGGAGEIRAGEKCVKKAMCNKNRPFCGECPLTAYCRYFREKN
jgi:3-methyladenine DNA glycosylase Tag